MKHAKKTAITTILALLIASTALFAEEQPQRRRQGQRRQQDQMQRGSQNGMRGGSGGQMGPGGMRGGLGMGQMPISRMLRTIKLTDEQKKQAKVITDKSKKAAELTRKQTDQATKALHDAVAKEASDEKIRECALAIGKAMGDQAVGRVKTIKDIKAILTEEQVKKFEDTQKRMKERMQQMQKRSAEKAPRDGDGDDDNEHRRRPNRNRPERGERNRR